MRYIITEKEFFDELGNPKTINILEVVGYNILFGWDTSPEYDSFRNALEIKGIDAFVDLLIADSNTAFLTFTES